MSFSCTISEFNFTLSNYIYFFTSSGKFLTYLKNSFIVAVGSGLIQIPICLPGGYVLARHKSKLINFANAFFPLSIIIPWTVILVSVLMFYLRIGLYDSLIGLILHHASFSSLFIAWIYGTFISSIPIEIEEAAELDGCSKLRIIFQIDMPLIIRGVAASFVWVFINVWNTFLVAAFLIESTENIVFAQALYNALTYLLSGGMLNLNYAATIIFIIPPLILFIIFRRWITRIMVY
jgi:ABC-type glycerol-3-phosphate transport system permease component